MPLTVPTWERSVSSDRVDETPRAQITDMLREMALLRENAEPVFATPGEAKSFGLAVDLHETGVYELQEFGVALVAEIPKSEQTVNSSTYSKQWPLEARKASYQQRCIDDKRNYRPYGVTIGPQLACGC